METGLETFYRFFQRDERVTGESFHAIVPATRRSQGDFDPAGDPLLVNVAERRSRFLEAMDDDFNTGGAIGDLFELVRRLNKFIEDEKLESPAQRAPAKIGLAASRGGRATRVGATLGLFDKPAAAKPAADDALTGQLMARSIDLRAQARKKKDFATADQIRNSLMEMGITLEDRPGGTDWSRA